MGIDVLGIDIIGSDENRLLNREMRYTIKGCFYKLFPFTVFFCSTYL